MVPHSRVYTSHIPSPIPHTATTVYTRPYSPLLLYAPPRMPLHHAPPPPADPAPLLSATYQLPKLHCHTRPSGEVATSVHGVTNNGRRGNHITPWRPLPRPRPYEQTSKDADRCVPTVAAPGGTRGCLLPIRELPGRSARTCCARAVRIEVPVYCAWSEKGHVTLGRLPTHEENKGCP